MGWVGWFAKSFLCQTQLLLNCCWVDVELGFWQFSCQLDLYRYFHWFQQNKTLEQKEYLLDTKFSEKYLKDTKYPLNGIGDWNCLFDEVHLNGSMVLGGPSPWGLSVVGALEGCRSPPGIAIPSTASTTAMNSDHCDVTDFRPMREEHCLSWPIQ